MKIMYVASQPDDGTRLLIETEINAFQRRLLDRSLADVHVLFYSDISVERLRATIRDVKPDILHISLHSDHGELRFRNERNNLVAIEGKALATLLPPHNLTKLAVFSSCKSSEIALQVAPKFLATVGFTELIEEHTAVLVSLQLYEELLEGRTISESFESCKARLAVEQPDGIEAKIYGDPNVLASTILYRPSSIVARIVVKTGKNRKADSLKKSLVEIGLDGAPSDLVQIVFFTDERSWAFDTDYNADNELSLECWRAARMAKVVYGPTPIGGCIWAETPEVQVADEWIYAAVIRTGGPSFIVKSSISEALLTGLARGFADSASKEVLSEIVGNFKFQAKTRSIHTTGD